MRRNIMSHVSASKARCGGLASALLALAVTGCSSTGAPTSEVGDRLWSHGVTAVVPASWHRESYGWWTRCPGGSATAHRRLVSV